jgi:predicted TIM-barrel fold metal-dependent hydrolase
MAAAPALLLPGCRNSDRYTTDDEAQLEAQQREERELSGKGPYGAHRYRGYRGLAELPWYELDEGGRLRCVAEDLPRAIDIHAHLGMALLFAPDIDLLARTPRVRHLLDCDAEEPGCELDLDVYINANFKPADLRGLRFGAISQATWGNAAASTQTIPNLIDEMDACRVDRAAILPICFGLPLGDDLAYRWMDAIDESGQEERFILGASVHPRDPDAVPNLRRQAERGARIVKLHPAVQRFFPDSPELEPIYRACAELHLPIIFHGGRAGIEPKTLHKFTLMRHYESAFKKFPEVQFVLGHAGARDLADAIPLAQKYPNVWMGIHGQGVSRLRELVDRVGGDRLLFGTDWPFYHLAATHAKVLIISEGEPELRRAILRDNALRLFETA